MKKERNITGHRCRALRAKRSVWLAALLVSLSMLPVSCSDDEAADTENGQWVVTAITSANGVGDRSYTDLIYAGLRQSENTLDIRLRVIVPASYEEAGQYIDAWLDDKAPAADHRLLIAASGEYEAYLSAKADRLPDGDNARVMLLESKTKDAPYYTVRLPSYGAGYTAGYITPLLNGGDTAAVILANTSESTIVNCHEAYRDGFHDAGGKRLDVYPLADDQTGYAMADSLYRLCYSLDGHYGMVMPIAGGSCQGVLRYTRENPSAFFTAGMDVDQQENSYAVAFSILKHIDRAVLNFVTAWRSGQPLERHYSYGLASGYMEVKVADDSRFDNLRSAVDAVRPRALSKEDDHEKDR
ncbi:MAG: hypothetical protein ACI4BA_00640 [Prevotella sp.]